MNFRIFNGGVDGLMKLQRMHARGMRGDCCPVVVRFRVGRTLRTSTSSFTTTTMTRRWTRPDGTRTSDAAVRLPHARYNQHSTDCDWTAIRSLYTEHLWAVDLPLCSVQAYFVTPALRSAALTPYSTRGVFKGGGEPAPPKLGKH